MSEQIGCARSHKERSLATENTLCHVVVRFRCVLPAKRAETLEGAATITATVGGGVALNRRVFRRCSITLTHTLYSCYRIAWSDDLWP